MISFLTLKLKIVWFCLFDCSRIKQRKLNYLTSYPVHLKNVGRLDFLMVIDNLKGIGNA